MTAPALHRPTTLDEACAMLASLDEPMVYGGGTAIQILTKQGVLFAENLVDLSLVPGLAELDADPSGLVVGAMTPVRRMERDARVGQVAPVAAAAYGKVANARVRNTATVGGNIAHGDYRLDPPTALLALDATVEAVSVRGTRGVPVREFFVGFQETALARDELIRAIRIPAQPETSGSCFVKLTSLGENDWPCASAAAVIVADGERREVRLGLGALAAVPCYGAVDVTGLGLADAVRAALSVAEELMDPIPDIRGGAPFKRRLGRVAVEDAVRGAWKDLAHA